MSNIGGKYFAPKPGRYGVIPEVLTYGSLINQQPFGVIQTANFGVPYRKLRVLRFSAVARIAPGLVSAGAVLPCTISKLSNNGVTSKALTSAFDLTTLTPNTVSQIPILSTLNPPDLILQEGDILQARITISVSLTTQPVDLAYMAEINMAE